MQVTFKFVKYNRPDWKHTEAKEIFLIGVRDCLLLFYTPWHCLSSSPLALALEKEGRKSGEGEEGQSEIPREGCVTCASFTFWCLFRWSLCFFTVAAKYILHDLKKSFWLNITPWGWLFSSTLLKTYFEVVYLILLSKFSQHLPVRCIKSPPSFLVVGLLFRFVFFLYFEVLNSCGLSVCQPLLQIAHCPSVPWASWLVWEMQCSRSFWPPLGLGMMVSVVRKQVVSILNCNGEVVRQHTVLAG